MQFGFRINVSNCLHGFRSPKNLQNDTKLGYDLTTYENDLSQGSQIALRSTRNQLMWGIDLQLFEPSELNFGIKFYVSNI